MSKAKNSKPSKVAAKVVSSKVDTIIALLRRKQGVDLKELTKATGWQPHSVRGALSGTVKKKLGLPITSEKVDGRHVYRLLAD